MFLFVVVVIACHCHCHCRRRRCCNRRAAAILLIPKKTDQPQSKLLQFPLHTPQPLVELLLHLVPVGLGHGKQQEAEVHACLQGAVVRGVVVLDIDGVVVVTIFTVVGQQ